MIENRLVNHKRFFQWAQRYLFVLLLLMVAGFFTWSENILITRSIKTVGRMGVLLATIYVYRRILQYGAVDTLGWKNSLSISLYLAYLLLGAASFMWSTKVGYSSLQWFMTVQSLVFSFFFIRCIALLNAYFQDHPIRLFNLLGNTVYVLMLVFVLGMYIAPDVFFRMTHGGEEARLGGYIMNPNELGMLAGLGIACLIFDLYRGHQRGHTIFKLLLIGYALFLTGSRSSLIGVVLIVLFHIHISDRKLVKIGVLAGMLMVLPFAVNKIILKDEGRLEEVMSMTGRLPFWKDLINEGLPREPYWGFGFMRIDYKDYFQSRHSYPGKMTHNTFLQVLMNLGFVGLVLVLFQLLFTIRGLLKAERNHRLMLLGIFIPILINSLTEFGIFGESNYGILFYQLLIFSISFQNNGRLTKIERIRLKRKRPELFQLSMS